MRMVESGTKVCRKCGRELPIGDFYVNRMSKDGHRNICKRCYVEQVMRHSTDNPDHQVKHRSDVPPVMKTCAECGRELPESEFLDSMGRRVGSGRCRECREKHRDYQREYREANREKVRALCRESMRRRRAGEPKRRPGPPKMEESAQSEPVYQSRLATRPSTFPLGKKRPVKAERSCEKCVNWPCFDGIENLESDFASEGCHAYRKRGEAS